MLKSGVRFGLVGLANTLVGLAIIAVLLRAGAGDYLANAASYSIGLCLSFVLNRAWTFGQRGPVAGIEARRFVIVFVLSYGANLAVLTLMRGIGFGESLIGQGAGMVVYSVCFFLLSRRYVFRVEAESA
ncbi:Putative flippase GtrA (transmembrane translocase of bactoprenol-linked glucose) [Novosphingobium sp. CF614]|uniref:GtrA family protein n=1 Tax=Novosphingobium sp. CF614 TaxID=1884364 RepID=UPI0008E33D07|nr:GtrA family protein [Novosphingobium sp. CF614]SFF85920.1 Putative flippase GtrA (transmembrane translocase of bactoprenol-linked glucose) [Novosphingobium sp. CF614]